MIDLKKKILSILAKDCDADIKADLIHDVYMGDKTMMVVADKYKDWFLKRDELMVSVLGIEGFVLDDCTLTKEELWGRFVDFLKDEEK